jgi:hypothetical protein
MFAMLGPEAMHASIKRSNLKSVVIKKALDSFISPVITTIW